MSKDPLIGRKEQLFLLSLQQEAFSLMETREFEAEDQGPAEGKEARRKAWDAQLRVLDGAKSTRFKAWRKALQESQLGVESLTQMRRSQFRGFKAHLLTLTNKPGALAAAMATGRPVNSVAPDDTVEARDRWIWKIEQALRRHRAGYQPSPSAPEPITPAYVLGLARRNNGLGSAETRLSTLPAPELRKLFFTVERAISLRQASS
ncbi:hypothetical protein AAFN60_01850 [Roseibacillus persicicus]|uniref:hypothetical protein n=1 Tax=Roseibacillus persicicus TaxID=454148 RepID=UPI00398B85BB